MDNIKLATDLLRQTESKLRMLVSQAATSGDYSSVVTIAAWARTLCELLNGAPREERRVGADPRLAQQIRKVAKETPPFDHPPRRIERAYPKFFRKGDQLIRVAWSKREKKEYRHKAPSGTLKALAAAMAQHGAEGRVFSTDEFLPIHVAENGEVPNYQAYVGISLLKQAGLIDQHGRQGYSIPRLAEFKDAVDAVWKKLPEL